jgi:integrase
LRFINDKCFHGLLCRMLFSNASVFVENNIPRKTQFAGFRNDLWAVNGGGFLPLNKGAVKSFVDWSDPDTFITKKCKAVPIEARPKLEAITKAGKKLPNISPHDLRHTAATLMLRRNVPVEVVSRILGHARVSITMDIYRHVLESEKQAVMVDLFDVPLPTRTIQPTIPN